jgi:hypothetical protein
MVAAYTSEGRAGQEEGTMASEGTEVQEQLEFGFGTAVFVLDHTAAKLTPEEAERVFGEVTKENFWRMWPNIRSWAESLFEMLDEDRMITATPVEDEELDDVGGGG